MLCGGQRQELLHFAVSEYDIWRSLERFIVAPLIPVTDFGGTNQHPDLRKEHRDLVDGRLIMAIQQFVDTDDHVGQGMKPGKPGVVHHKLQQLPGGIHTAIDSLIGQLFGDDQGLVQT